VPVEDDADAVAFTGGELAGIGGAGVHRLPLFGQGIATSLTAVTVVRTAT
jgi:hypothetical protein